MINREDIIRMAREADREWDCDRDMVEWLEWFAALVAAAEREIWMQLFTDPENQPTQYGTVSVEYIQREIASAVEREREACAALVEAYIVPGIAIEMARVIRARGNT